MSHIIKGHEVPFTIGVALNGAGWHAAAWRESDAHPSSVTTGAYWKQLAELAEEAGFDYLAIEDSLSLPSSTPFSREVPARPRPDRLETRLDAQLVASWIAPHTKRVGIIPTITTTHTEPFHVATGLQTVDHVSHGRAGWQLRFSAGQPDAAAFGRRSAPEIDVAAVLSGDFDAGLQEVVDDAADAAEVARRLWDSWEDDAIIRDAATGRFLDRDRVHHINFEGEHFSVIGPSIVPRSPQGQLPITLLAHSPQIFALAARVADVVFITPDNSGIAAGASSGRSAAEIIAQVRAAEEQADRQALGLAPLRIVADAIVAIDSAEESGADRLARLNELSGEPLASDAVVLTGSAAHVAERIAAWADAGVEGVRIRPLTIPTDLRGVADDLLPLLRKQFASAPETSTLLRERFGLAPAANRYASTRQENAA